MIEKHYARWMAEETPEEIAGLGGHVAPMPNALEGPAIVAAEHDSFSRHTSDRAQRAGTLPGTFDESARNPSKINPEGGDSNLRVAARRFLPKTTQRRGLSEIRVPIGSRPPNPKRPQTTRLRPEKAGTVPARDRSGDAESLLPSLTAFRPMSPRAAHVSRGG
jgi:hypothetical protein